eukprot:SAG31_NODE_5707_length_2369_cov_5.515859_2_plen_142_part_00
MYLLDGLMMSLLVTSCGHFIEYLLRRCTARDATPELRVHQLANGASAGLTTEDPDFVSVRIYAKSLPARAYRVSLLGARAGYITPKLSVVNLLYLIKNDTPGLKPQNDTQLISVRARSARMTRAGSNNSTSLLYPSCLSLF